MAPSLLKCNDGGERQVGTGNGLAAAATLGKTAVTGEYRSSSLLSFALFRKQEKASNKWVGTIFPIQTYSKCMFS